MTKLVAKDIMNPRVISIPDDWPVQKLAEFLVERAITGAPVVDADGRLVGVVSLMDIARFESETKRGVEEEKPHEYYLHSWEDALSPEEVRVFHITDPPDCSVRDIMTPMVFKVEANTPVAEIAGIMVHGRVHRLLVVNNNQMIGIITALDLVKLLEAPGH
ncbi:MAG: CBS domain-containing protein [Deferribacteres bacterium]|nr:CBS domain-containing protein [candidate division KSB1 bacterium]MCB9511476.1 CBS domain-containing protein [Deferribacteres bacterium]